MSNVKNRIFALSDDLMDRLEAERVRRGYKSTVQVVREILESSLDILEAKAKKKGKPS